MSIKKFLFTGITTCLIASSTIPIYNNGKVLVVIEYDKEDAKAFKKLTKADLEKLVTAIATEITTTLGKQDIPIQGIIIEDDAAQPTHQFAYNNGKLDIK